MPACFPLLRRLLQPQVLAAQAGGTKLDLCGWGAVGRIQGVPTKHHPARFLPHLLLAVPFWLKVSDGEILS